MLHDVSIISYYMQFRRTVWIKHGDYVICEPIDEGDKVKAEIVSVLVKEDLIELHSLNVLPAHFVDTDAALSRMLVSPGPCFIV